MKGFKRLNYITIWTRPPSEHERQLWAAEIDHRILITHDGYEDLIDAIRDYLIDPTPFDPD